MNILLTGSTGYIGSTLKVMLQDQGHTVTGISRKDAREERQLNLADKNAYSVLDTYSFDAVIHSAACISFNEKDYDKLIENNVLATKLLLDFATEKKIARFVFISAGATLGTRKIRQHINEKRKFVPGKKDVYALSKMLAEKEVMDYKDRIHTVILNPSTVYGPGDKNLNSGLIIKSLKNSGPFQIVPPGGTSYVDIRDLNRAIGLALEKTYPSGEKFIISGGNLDYKELFREILSVVGKKPWMIRVPFSAYYLAKSVNRITRSVPNEIFEGLFSYRFFDTEKAKKQLDWKPENDFRSTLQDAIQYYKEQNLWN